LNQYAGGVHFSIRRKKKRRFPQRENSAFISSANMI